ncbi:hypothetical protein BC351_23480 [Paenibacillus ferrarius]|uniref:DUF4179 domain-containing protein n=1 Tax=Paenibacillus ferrarius TaxID=1469647 RepID=A0A1V4HLG6_9BACL|nr:DUF4179 domain-containing protein [Paenibacillus ferrarius]OPH58330.1 hypothetical protein BC351_23480 [Paenibacillus ferrarius]
MNENSLEQRLREDGRQSKKEMPDIVRATIDRTLANLSELHDAPESRNQDVSPAKSRRLLKLLSWRIAVYTSIAGLLIVLIVGTVPAVAKALSRIPILNSILHLQGDTGLKQASEKGVTTEINQSVANNGVIVKITDVLYDGSRLSIGYVTESLDGERAPSDMTFSVSVDGQVIQSNRSGIGSEIGHTFAGVIQFITEKEFPETIRLNLDITHIGNQDGRWNFEFPVTKLNGSSGVQTYLPMKSKTASPITLTIKKVGFTPSATVLDTEMIRPKSSYGSYPNVSFHLIDDRGMIMKHLSASGYGDANGSNEIVRQTSLYEPMDHHPNSIRILPYTRPSTKIPEMHKWRVVPDHKPTNENPIIIEPGGSDLFRLVITKLDFTSEATTVAYRMENNPDIFSQNLYMEDETGNERLGKSKIKYIDPTHYEFESVYPPYDPKKQITFVYSYGDVNVITFDELEMSIPIR